MRGPRAQKQPMSGKQAPFRVLLAVSAFSRVTPKIAYLYRNVESYIETWIKMIPKGHAFGRKRGQIPLKLIVRGPRVQKEPMSGKQAPFWVLLAVSAVSRGAPKVAYLYRNEEFSHETWIRMTPKGHAFWPKRR